MTSRNLLRLVTPSGGDPVENAAMAATIVAAVAFDHVVGGRLAVNIGFATVVALLLRRPADVIPLLGVAFLTTTATSFLRGSGAASLVDGALDIAVAQAVLVGARLVGGTGRRIRTARISVEVLFVVALAAPLAGAGAATILMGTPLGDFVHLERLAD